MENLTVTKAKKTNSTTQHEPTLDPNALLGLSVTLDLVQEIEAAADMATTEDEKRCYTVALAAARADKQRKSDAIDVLRKLTLSGDEISRKKSEALHRAQAAHKRWELGSIDPKEALAIRDELELAGAEHRWYEHASTRGESHHTDALGTATDAYFRIRMNEARGNAAGIARACVKDTADRLRDPDRRWGGGSPKDLATGIISDLDIGLLLVAGFGFDVRPALKDSHSEIDERKARETFLGWVHEVAFRATRRG